ncbi:DUF6894 family protein [Roseomonas chloroacetimidivorans]|uniref:DUF6894 family protein n=1 Tax=Roseomonas chloroacetimidivorans TaxID=1766656 RepID=UPI003C724D8E
MIYVLAPLRNSAPSLSVPQCFFDTHDSDRHFKDAVGLNLPDPTATRAAGIAALHDVLHEKRPDGDMHAVIIDVRDADRRRIYTAAVSLIGRWVD